MPGSDGDADSPTLVVSWDDSPAIQVEVVQRPRVVTSLGMRPERLTYHGKAIYYPSNAEWYEHMHRRLTRLAAAALERHQAGKVLSTLALGWDTALAEAAVGLSLPLSVGLPFKGLQSRWRDGHKQRFGRLMDKAGDVLVLSTGGYQPWKYQKALEHKILESDLVLALWDEEDAPTKEGVALAYRNEREITNLWGSWVRYGKMIQSDSNR